MIKTGAQHIHALKDGRQVYINGGRVDDVQAARWLVEQNDGIARRGTPYPKVAIKDFLLA